MNKHMMHFVILRLQHDYSCEITYNIDALFDGLAVCVYFCPPNEEKNFEFVMRLDEIVNDDSKIYLLMAKKIEERLHGKG